MRAAVFVGLPADGMEDTPKVAVLPLLGGGQAVQQVAFGDEAEEPAGAVHNRQAGDAALDHRFGHDMQRGVRGYGRGRTSAVVGFAGAHRSAPGGGILLCPGEHAGGRQPFRQDRAAGWEAPLRQTMSGDRHPLSRAAGARRRLKPQRCQFASWPCNGQGIRISHPRAATPRPPPAGPGGRAAGVTMASPPAASRGHSPWGGRDQFHAIAVRVAQVDRLGDAMVGRALQRNAGLQHPPQRLRQRRPIRVEQRDMIEAGGAGRRPGAALALPGVQRDVVVIAAGREEDGLVGPCAVAPPARSTSRQKARARSRSATLDGHGRSAGRKGPGWHGDGHRASGGLLASGVERNWERAAARSNPPGP